MPCRCPTNTRQQRAGQDSRLIGQVLKRDFIQLFAETVDWSTSYACSFISASLPTVRACVRCRLGMCASATFTCFTHYNCGLHLWLG